MSKEYDEMWSRIIDCLDRMKRWREAETADEILSLETETLRLAVVRKEGELTIAQEFLEAGYVQEVVDD